MARQANSYPKEPIKSDLCQEEVKLRIDLLAFLKIYVIVLILHIEALERLRYGSVQDRQF
jgi:diacylglycerol kinase